MLIKAKESFIDYYKKKFKGNTISLEERLSNGKCLKKYEVELLIEGFGYNDQKLNSLILHFSHQQIQSGLPVYSGDVYFYQSSVPRQ